MKRAIALLAAMVTVALVAYLSWLNPTPVEFSLTPTYRMAGHLGSLMVFAFLTGAGVVMLGVSVQAGRRAFVSWRGRRRQRRNARIEEWEARGEQLVWAGDPQHGRALLQKAWQRRPDHAHAAIALAASYRDTGELHRARGLLFDAASQFHTNPDILFALAEVYAASGERGPCIEVLERLRALHPRAPRVLRALRDAYVDSERWADAASLQEALISELRDTQQAARERESLTALRYEAAMALTEPEAHIQALEALADSRNPPLPPLVSLGDALLANGRGDEASVIWERALRTTPRTVLVQRLAALATETKHRDRLRTLLRKLRGDHVNTDHVHLLAAELHLADGNLDAAAAELELAGTDTAGRRHYLWGEVHRQRGQLDQAVAAYAQAAAAAPAFQCTACRRSSDEWVGRCPQCGRWDSYRAAVEIGAT